MKMHKSLYFFTVYLFFCVNFSLAQNQEKYDIENYKKLIVYNYYLFQKTEDLRLLSKTLRFIKLNKFVVKEDTIQSKIYYLKGIN
ncbi:hypothetical protein CSC82_24235, partial [Rhodobacteraceae bacterium 4F10]